MGKSLCRIRRNPDPHVFANRGCGKLLQNARGSGKRQRDQPVRHRPDGDLCARAEAKLIKDVVDVIARSPLRDRQRLGDFTIGQSACNQRRNFLLAPGKRILSGNARCTSREGQGGCLCVKDGGVPASRTTRRPFITCPCRGDNRPYSGDLEGEADEHDVSFVHDVILHSTLHQPAGSCRLPRRHLYKHLPKESGRRDPVTGRRALAPIVAKS
jgi:hypothetical protein